ncbi:hypothetical protein D3C77_516130 [compost metagenome]
MVACARSVLGLYQISVRWVSSAPAGKPHFRPMANSSLVAVRNVTAGGNPALPVSCVRLELFHTDEISKALTARTRARYAPA